jgi:hypothetical protein
MNPLWFIFDYPELAYSYAAFFAILFVEAGGFLLLMAGTAAAVVRQQKARHRELESFLASIPPPLPQPPPLPVDESLDEIHCSR